MVSPPTRPQRFAASLLRPIMSAVTRKDWHGVEHLPRDTGFIAVSNHVSYADPLTLAHYLYDNDAVPRFLAKNSLFELPVVGRVLKAADQIPVYRNTVRAGDALIAAREVLARGDMVAIFPEGTLTRDPDLWPMLGRTGVGRLALETGVPVIPVAQWGAHRLLNPYGKLPKPCPRKTITVIAGPPIDLEDLAGSTDKTSLRLATDRIMATLTTMVERIRGERAPAVPFDMRTGHGGSAGTTTEEAV